MAKKFSIPDFYQSPIIRTIKERSQILDPRKKDMKPSVLDFGPIQFLIPRHFGFCYGVQNAIDIAYRSVEEQQGKRIFLLSEMIHNPDVNADLQKKGIQFLFETDGKERIPLSEINQDDVVIVPAFGTTVEMQKTLEAKGIDPYRYDTTCPFVEKVWKRGKQIGDKGYNMVIHGKYQHEETRATFSHAAQHSKVVVVYNVEEAEFLADCMLGNKSLEEFESKFGHKCTKGFNPQTDLEYFGVINQTTMLATETKEVMQVLRNAATIRFGEAEAADHMADTNDTLCYATNENQSATLGLREEPADLAIVVGGYNSSNTLHIVELLEHKMPTYHIRNASEFEDEKLVQHYNQWTKSTQKTQNWLQTKSGKVTVSITSGASCPDALVDEVILKIVGLFEHTKSIDDAMKPFIG
jgi:4-hydroxy-3-methylbut-2-en-1-yl diphosphate reductase